MTNNHDILGIPFFLALLATIFCVWTALGNDVNICVTTGCSLYQDFTLFGISLWWIGTCAFAILGALALLGQAYAGYLLSSFFLLCDAGFLVLMALTAPCISCLLAALFFLLCCLSFKECLKSNSFVKKDSSLSNNLVNYMILSVWSIFFIINLGQVIRSQLDVWPILDESGQAKAKIFFSPSCPHCIEAINVLSGNINIAFYPVAENEADIARIEKMCQLLAEGMNIAEALGKSLEMESSIVSFSPEMLLLRFRLLRNKAHVFAAGSPGVPFFEYMGTPPSIMEKIKDRKIKMDYSPEQDTSPPDNKPTDHTLPVELEDSGQCIGGTPCPPIN